jgi:hypothetical protein
MNSSSKSRSSSLSNLIHSKSPLGDKTIQRNLNNNNLIKKLKKWKSKDELWGCRGMKEDFELGSEDLDDKEQESREDLSEFGKVYQDVGMNVKRNLSPSQLSPFSHNSEKTFDLNVSFQITS